MKIIISDKSCEEVKCIDQRLDNLEKHIIGLEKLLSDQSDFVSLNSLDSDPCKNCLNNPKNGGSGICFCTLGLNITC